MAHKFTREERQRGGRAKASDWQKQVVAEAARKNRPWEYCAGSKSLPGKLISSFNSSSWKKIIKSDEFNYEQRKDRLIEAIAIVRRLAKELSFKDRVIGGCKVSLFINVSDRVTEAHDHNQTRIVGVGANVGLQLAIKGANDATIAAARPEIDEIRQHAIAQIQTVLNESTREGED
jgi:hypothetical protein